MNSLGDFGLIPAELLRHVCQTLSFDDVLNLSRASADLGVAVESVVCTDMHKMRVAVQAHNTELYLTRVSSGRTATTSSDGSWREVIGMCNNVRRLEVDVSRDASTSAVLDVLERKDMPVKSLTLRVRNGERNVSITSTVRMNKKLINIVKSFAPTLSYLEASTSDADVVIAKIDSNGHLHLSYSHRPDAASEVSVHHQLLYPIFTAMLDNRPSASVTLQIDSKEKPSLALQNAFQLALPHSNRAHLRQLTIEFGSTMKEVAEEEVKGALLRHVEYHDTTPNLQEFTCRLPHTTIEASSLEELHVALSEQMRQERRISLQTPSSQISAATRRVVSCK